MKRWWLPSQKGTDMWPRQTVMPPKLIIEGVGEHTPLYRDLAERFGSRLKRFHGAAQQQYALSPNDVMKLREQWDDGQAQYVNLQGQEILRLTVHPQLLVEQPKPNSENVPDYAVVDLIVPGSSTMYCEFVATLMVPDVGREVANIPFWGDVIRGIEFDVEGWGDYSDGYEAGAWPEDIIRYTDPYHLTGEVAVANRVSSLLVNFTSLGSNSMVIVRLYGQLYPDDTNTDPPATDEFIGWTRAYPLGEGSGVMPPVWSPSGTLISPACLTGVLYYKTYSGPVITHPDPNPLFNVDGVDVGDQTAFLAAYRDPYSHTDYSGLTFTDVLFPATVHEITDQYWADWTQTGGSPDHLGTESITSGPYYDAGYRQVDYWQAIHYYHNHAVQPYRPVYDSEYNGVTPVAVKDCDLTYAFYDPGQKFFMDALKDNSDSPYVAMWTVLEGEQPSRTKFATAHMDSRDSGVVSENNPWGLPFIGTLTFARRQRAVSFKQASAPDAG